LQVDLDCLLGPAGDGPDGDLLFAVSFHHFSVDSSGRGLTLFWNGFASCEPGPAGADEQDDGVIVTVTERRPRGAISAAGQGRRSAVKLGTPWVIGRCAIDDEAQFGHTHSPAVRMSRRRISGSSDASSWTNASDDTEWRTTRA
jgi:hypothetical protein